MASTTKPVAATAADVAKTSVVSTGCISGSCLKVDMMSWQVGGAGGALALHWPIPGNQQQAYFRYYMKLAPNFDPSNRTTQGGSTDSGGKFPGLADVRVFPEEQCGNGGAFADGINCWSLRSKYRDCSANSAHICADPAATTRFGGYNYIQTNRSFDNFGPWDDQAWGSQGGACSDPSGLRCGSGPAGLVNDRWYRIEYFVKMNDPGVANGVIRGWLDGVLKYEKTNVAFRLPGHNNLHVRTAWLNVHAGGEFVGPDESTSIYLDQMVVATGAQIGAWKAPTAGSSSSGGSTSSSGGSSSTSSSGGSTSSSSSSSGGSSSTSSSGGSTSSSSSSGGSSTSSSGGSAPVGATACVAPSAGKTALQAAANGLAAGKWCELQMNGLTWSLISPAGVAGAPDTYPWNQENDLEYGANGVYDAARKKVRYLTGPHSGTNKATSYAVVMLEYDEATNTWSLGSRPGEINGGHGYDHTAMDTATGDTYVRGYLVNRYWRWDGSTWTALANNTCEPAAGEPAVGTAWDPDRNGLLTFSDSSGVCLWHKPTNTWNYLGHAPGVQGSYHFVAEYNPAAKIMWLQDGNGKALHWKLDSTNKLTLLKAPPISLGCCGSGGTMSTYDYGSKKFIVADPFGNRWYEFDIATDTWKAFSNTLPLNQSQYDSSNVEGFVTPISSYGVIMYVMARGTGAAPRAYLYRHAN